MAASAAVEIAADADNLSAGLRNLAVRDLDQSLSPEEIWDLELNSEEGVCAICLDEISLQETALVKGCEHAYCVTCILEWAAFSKSPLCPQCKQPFEFIHLHRSLDGSLHDYLFEESVCLLLRATWFVKDDKEVAHDEVEDPYEDDDLDVLEDIDYSPSLNLSIVGGGWPVQWSNSIEPGSSSSHKNKEVGSKSATGRRAKRALKREAASKGVDEAVASDRERLHLVRLGRTGK